MRDKESDTRATYHTSSYEQPNTSIKLRRHLCDAFEPPDRRYRYLDIESLGKEMVCLRHKYRCLNSMADPHHACSVLLLCLTGLSAVTAGTNDRIVVIKAGGLSVLEVGGHFGSLALSG